jgi:hypothetical protein
MVHRKLFTVVLALLVATFSFAQHGVGTKGKVFLIASNPSVSKQTG